MSSMRPCKTKLRFFADGGSELYGKLSPDISGDGLSRLLASNSLLLCYRQNSTVTVNNLLWGVARNVECPYFDPDKPPLESRVSWRRVRRRVQKAIEKGGIYFLNWLYPPISKGYVQDIIEIDEVFRASKAYAGPQTVYRGTVCEEKLNLNCLVSTTTNYDVAAEFSRGSILKIDLPAGFPRIDMTIASNPTILRYNCEHEILLPPCEFEVLQRESLPRSYRSMNMLTVRLSPKSLAKVLLEKMDNLPPGYSREFRTNPIYEFDEAHELLKSYVENYVDKGLIKIGSSIFHEKDIDFAPKNEDQPGE